MTVHEQPLAALLRSPLPDEPPVIALVPQPVVLGVVPDDLARSEREGVHHVVAHHAPVAIVRPRAESGRTELLERGVDPRLRQIQCLGTAPMALRDPALGVGEEKECPPDQCHQSDHRRD